MKGFKRPFKKEPLAKPKAVAQASSEPAKEEKTEDAPIKDVNNEGEISTEFA